MFAIYLIKFIKNIFITRIYRLLNFIHCKLQKQFSCFYYNTILLFIKKYFYINIIFINDCRKRKAFFNKICMRSTVTTSQRTNNLLDLLLIIIKQVITSASG